MSITLILVISVGFMSFLGGWCLIFEGFKEKDVFKIITGISVMITTWVFLSLSL